MIFDRIGFRLVFLTIENTFVQRVWPFVYFITSQQPIPEQSNQTQSKVYHHCRDNLE